MPYIAPRIRSNNDGTVSCRVKANRNTILQHGSRPSKGHTPDMSFPDEDHNSSGMRAMGIHSNYIRSRIWRHQELGDWNNVAASLGSAATALNTTSGDLRRGKEEEHCVLDVSIDDRIDTNHFLAGATAFDTAPGVAAMTAKPLGGMHYITPVSSLSTPRDRKLCHSSSTPRTMEGMDVLNTNTRQDDGDGDSHSVHSESLVRKNSGDKDSSQQVTPKPLPPLPISLVDRKQTVEGGHYKGYREDYALGETARSTSHMITESTSVDAIRIFDSLRNHDFVFIKRSNGSFSYASLAYRSRSKITNEECLVFVLDHKGSTKTMPKRHSHSMRLVSMEGLMYHPPIGTISFDPHVDDNCSVISSVSDRARASSRHQKVDDALMDGEVDCRLVGGEPKMCASPDAHQSKMIFSQRHEENSERSYKKYTPRAA